MFKLPIDAVKSFGTLLTDLDGNMGQFKLESYGVTMGTLEEIFMRFADGGDLAGDKDGDDTTPLLPVSSGEDAAAPVEIRWWMCLRTRRQALACR